MDISAKPKKKSLKEKWNNSGKNIFLKVLHGISYVLSAVFICLCIYSCSSSGKSAAKENKKGLFLDNHYSAYVNSDDASIFTYDEFCELMVTYTQECVNSITPKPSTFNQEIERMVSAFINDYGGLYYVCSTGDDESVLFEIDEGNLVCIDSEGELFLSLQNVSGVVSVFQYADSDFFDLSQMIYGDSAIYYNIYIGFNNSSLFGTLTESTQDFIGTLSQGLNNMVSLFYNNGLTTIGYLVTIVVAVALCWVLFRVIVGLIRLRG